MVEDIQIEMQQSTSNQVALSLQNQTQKRAPGGITNLQLDSSKNGNVGGSKFVNRRGSRNRQQRTNLNNNKRGLSNKTKNSLSRFDPEDKVSHRKNQSVDHLLNFHYMPLKHQHGGNVSHSNGFRRRRTTTFNKEAFLQANCQFVVDYNVEKYWIHSTDPDVLVDWNAIQLIYFPTHEQQNCPICLYPPTAAKMTKCGHVYCWSCILHYLSLTNKSWNKCPICHEAIHESDLKSVIPIVQNKFTRNGTIKMKLMKRPKSSLIAFTNDDFNKQEDNAFTIWDGDVPKTSSKLILATQEMVLENLLKREMIELTAQRSEALQEKSGEEAFIEMALKNIQMKIEAHSSSVGVSSPKKEEPKSEINYAEGNLANVLAGKDTIETKQQAFSDVEEENDDGDIGINIDSEECLGAVACESFPIREVTLPVLLTEKARNSESSSTDNSTEGFDPSPKQSSEYYYFYQAEDDQNIFINSLNARCLIEEYGSLENAPKTIIGQILDFESFSMTKELRRRYRYLSHLPLSCEFVICEMMLRPPVLSKQTIHNFMGEFKKRKAARLKRSEEQRKHDMRANAELSREAGFRVYHTDEPDIEIDLADMEAFPSSFSPNEPTTTTTTTNDASGSVGLADNVNGSSFSQIMNNSNRCWGKPSFSSAPQAVYTRSLNSTATTTQNVDGDEDGPNIVAPSLKEMFTAAMVMQSSSSAKAESSMSSGKKSTSKKGKKNKGTLLFATGAQRKY